jgi:hypothetical protein
MEEDQRQVRKKLSKKIMKRPRPDSNRGITVLQTAALPLGYEAVLATYTIITTSGIVSVVATTVNCRKENRLNGVPT